MPFWKKMFNRKQAVYYPRAIAPVMHTRTAQGKSVHIKGLGYFRYVLDTEYKGTRLMYFDLIVLKS